MLKTVDVENRIFVTICVFTGVTSRVLADADVNEYTVKVEYEMKKTVVVLDNDTVLCVVKTVVVAVVVPVNEKLVTVKEIVLVIERMLCVVCSRTVSIVVVVTCVCDRV